MQVDKKPVFEDIVEWEIRTCKKTLKQAVPMDKDKNICHIDKGTLLKLTLPAAQRMGEKGL